MAVNYRSMVRSYARKYGIPEELALAQIGAESGFNPNARSPAGAMGIAQFMPGTARGLGINPMDPRSALDGYGRHMRALIKNHHGNLKLALAAYNAGAGAVAKYGGIPPYAETQNYVSKIMSQVRSGQATGIPTPARARRAGGGAGAPGGSGAAGVPGAGAPQQLDPNTQALLQRWIAAEDKALSSKGMATRQTEAMWAKLEKRLLASASQMPAAGQQRAASNQVATAARGVASQTMAAAVGPGGLVPILAGQIPGSSQFGVQDAEGAPGAGGRYHAAVDWFGKAGAAVRSPVAGKVVEVKASRGNSGQVFGGVVKVQAPNGRVYVLRHVDPKGVKVGQRVGAGQQVAGITDWTGGSDHVHYEVWKTLAGGYNYSNMLDPIELYRR